MITNFFTNSMKFLLSFLLFMSMGTVFAHDDGNGDENDDGKRHRVRVVDCSHPHASIQRKVDRVTRRLGDRPVTIVIVGVCSEDVIIKKNDLTLVGEGGTVEGTITIRTARWVVIRNLTVTGPGAGVVGTENAAFTVEDSVIDRNGEAGIVVQNGAYGTITNNEITNNGQAGLPDTGRGILVNDDGSATINNNRVLDNRSDGIGVFNGSFARVQGNTIERNGRPAPVFDAGIQVSRAVVRGNRNVIRDNGYAAIEAFNNGQYRTGTFLNAVDNPDNIGPFEIIEGVGAGKVAVDLGQASYVDLRQVHVKGTVFVGRQSMLQVRGDNVLPNQTCSTIEGGLSVFGFNSGARLQFTRLTGFVFGLIEPTPGPGPIPIPCP